MCPAARVSRVAFALLGWLTIAVVGSAPGATGAALAGERPPYPPAARLRPRPPSGPRNWASTRSSSSNASPTLRTTTTRTSTTAPAPTASLPTTASTSTTFAPERSGRSSRPPTCPAARASSARSACRSTPRRSSSISARIPGAGFRIWEVHADGTGLRQVSFPPPDEAEKAARWRHGLAHRRHPPLLPAGRQDHLLLDPLRAHGPVRRVGPAWRPPVCTAWTPTAATSSSLPTARSASSARCVLDDGRVMYHRWEYIDRGARVAKTVWSMNPDGTRPQELFGLADDDTTVYMYPQPLPGSNHRFVCVGTCHYPQGGCLGPILLVDFGMGVRVPRPGSRTKPGYVPGDAAISGGQYHAAGVHPAPVGAGLAFPDAETASTCTTGKAARATSTRIPIPSATASSWSRTRSIRPIISGTLPTPTPCT